MINLITTLALLFGPTAAFGFTQDSGKRVTCYFGYTTGVQGQWTVGQFEGELVDKYLDNWYVVLDKVPGGVRPINGNQCLLIRTKGN